MLLYSFKYEESYISLHCFLSFHGFAFAFTFSSTKQEIYLI